MKYLSVLCLIWIQFFNSQELIAQDNKNDFQKYVHLSIQKSRTVSDSALFYAKKALNFTENALQTAFVNEIIAQILYEQGLYSVSVFYLLKSLYIYKNNQDQNRINAVLEKLGFLYVDARQIPQAEKQVKLLAQTYQRTQDVRMKIGYLLLEGYIAEKQHNVKKSLSFYEDAYKQYYNQANDSLKVIMLSSLGSIYEDEKEFDKARYFFQESFKLNEKRQDFYRMADNLNNLGDLERKKGDYKKGLIFTFRSLALAKEHKLSWFINSAYRDIYLSYEIANQLDSSLYYSKLYHKTILEIFDETSQKQLTQMGILYESEQMNKEIALQKVQLVTHQQRSIFLIIIAVVLLGLALFTYFHLRKQKATSKLLASQNAEISHQKEEIQQINEELNITLETVEQERQKADILLLNILPHSLAVELKEKGYATPQHYDLVSVLFTDFKGFTRAVENLRPIEVIRELDFCFNRFDEIAEEYGLERIKTIGDAYMAVGGLPVANTTNPVDAIKAGLEIQQFMNDLKKQRESEGKTAWQCRLGIHTGEVIAGVVGTKKFAYDIWGDTVNLASRMESSGEVGKVNISGTTYQLVKDEFQFEYRGKIEAKNKGEVEMYFVVPQSPKEE